MDLRENIAKNIAALRTGVNMTQLQLAERLNYSDKAVSKWERGDAIPDVIVLKEIADYFCVSVDYLLESDHGDGPNPSEEMLSQRRRNRITITIMSVGLVWLVATIVFAILSLAFPDGYSWLAFMFAIPVSSVVWLILNSVWGNRKLNFLIVTILLWSLILAVFLTPYMISGFNLWVLFIVGIPIQFLMVFLPGVGFFSYHTKYRDSKIKK